MGGHGLIRITRPMAPAGAVAALLAVLFVCLAPHGAPHGTADARSGGHPRAVAAGHTSGGHTAVRHTAVRHTADGPMGAGHTVVRYACPYDRGDCGLFPYLTPAVLTAPPLDPPPQAGDTARVGPDRRAGPPTAAGARPRAPDLHVLQVLRT
ncbi:hypothetical protein [Streptomyces lavendofoliae]|uniref:Uncharacterized protein n=1 Tax=Streptomyces lavendofoliae TaxID=67314 RepID=A0A918HS49_9ACTN|nr:hypothetical protein [Streptomyces lavendofoliae]GGU18785.1 hypothetical protein GCM10010274_01350 [Streptomyces lavendofoliae]